MTDKNRTKAKTMSLDKEIVARLEMEAQKDNRTVSNYVETLLIKHFEQLDHETTKR